MSDISQFWIKPKKIRKPPRHPRPCAAVLEHCERSARANGYCEKHDKRNRRYGTPYKQPHEQCAAVLEDCPELARCNGYCLKHNRRFSLYGSPYIVNKRGGWNAKKR